MSGPRTFDLTGDPDSTCEVDTGSTRVAVRDNAADDGAKGQAGATAAMSLDGRLMVSFEARSWDGATYHGTVSCLPRAKGSA